MHGRYSVLAHYLKVSLKNSRFLKIPKLHPQMLVFFLCRNLWYNKGRCTKGNCHVRFERKLA